MRQKYFFTIIYTLLSFCIFSQTTSPIDPIGPIEPADPPTGPPILFEHPPVGKTEGNLEVSLTGAAVYTVPIKVPQGVNGVEPKISLQYNSQSGNGIAGIGWGISGGSSITRVPSTLYHDGKVSAVNFSKDDRFALDGQRLILKSGTYGGDGAEYQTESYSNLKITSHGVSPYGTTYGPKYFTVTYPDGSIATYGNTNDSRSRTEFAINGWKNASGINMVYSYEEKGGILLLSSIKYVSKIVDYYTPSNDSLVITPRIDVPRLQLYDNEVKFNYSEWDVRKEEYYAGGVKFENNNHLSNIEVKSGGNLFRKYQLKLERDALGYNFLTEIKEYNGVDEGALPTVKFNYNLSLSNSYSLERSALFEDFIPTNLTGDVTARNFSVITGEFDGDGALDYILYNKNGKEYWMYYSTAPTEGQSVHKNLGNSSFSEIFPVQLKDANNVVLPQEGWVERRNTSFDVKSFSNGIIKDEFTRTYTFPKLKIEIKTKDCNYTREHTIPKLYLEGDFNGDGLTDIIAVEKPFHVLLPGCYSNIGYDEDKPHFDLLDDKTYRGGKTFLIDLHNSDTQINSDSGILNYRLSSKILTGNFLGSNKTDLLVIDDGTMSVYSYNGTNLL